MKFDQLEYLETAIERLAYYAEQLDPLSDVDSGLLDLIPALVAFLRTAQYAYDATGDMDDNALNIARALVETSH